MHGTLPFSNARVQFWMVSLCVKKCCVYLLLNKSSWNLIDETSVITSHFPSEHILDKPGNVSAFTEEYSSY